MIATEGPKRLPAYCSPLSCGCILVQGGPARVWTITMITIPGNRSLCIGAKPKRSGLQDDTYVRANLGARATMPTTSHSPEWYHSRPLPPIPTSVSSSPEPSSLLPSSASASSPQANYDDHDRNSILTFASIGTDLPRYSTIDFLDPNFAIEQVDHWSEGDNHTASATGALVDNQPPDYTLNGNPMSPHPPTSPRPPISGGRKPHFVLHKFHLGGGGNKIGLGKGKQSTHQPWATLKLVSRPATPGSRVRVPRFIGGDVLRGSVDLSLDAPMNVHSIKLIVSALSLMFLVLRELTR